MWNLPGLSLAGVTINSVNDSNILSTCVQQFLAIWQENIYQVTVIYQIVSLNSFWAISLQKSMIGKEHHFISCVGE